MELVNFTLTGAVSGHAVIFRDALQLASDGKLRLKKETSNSVKMEPSNPVKKEPSKLLKEEEPSKRMKILRKRKGARLGCDISKALHKISDNAQ